MNAEEIEAALDRAEQALAAGGGLQGTRFWRAVDAVRRDHALADRYADRIAAIDRRAFESGVRLRVPAWLGLTALFFGMLLGFLIVGIAFYTWGGPLCGFDTPCDGSPVWVAALFFAGFAMLIVTTHCLAHWVVGKLVGIRFTHVFLGGPPPPRPGLKTDYASYLRVPPRARAAMHASGAIVTKIIPFAFLVPAVRLYFGWNWVTGVLLGIGVVQIVTDVVLSTKVSDWKKVLRELRAGGSGGSSRSKAPPGLN